MRASTADTTGQQRVRLKKYGQIQRTIPFQSINGPTIRYKLII